VPLLRLPVLSQTARETTMCEKYGGEFLNILRMCLVSAGRSYKYLSVQTRYYQNHYIKGTYHSDIHKYM
jgi:hypothetical protein